MDAVSEVGAEEEKPKMPSNGFRCFVSLRVRATGGGASWSAGWRWTTEVDWDKGEGVVVR